MDVQMVDERDSSWEDESPRFRVYLFRSATLPGSSTSTYDITGADVLQVIDWAQRATTGTYAVALVGERGGGESSRGLTWLVGIDGNDSRPEAEPVFARMMARRAHPVGIPDLDRSLV